jgi:hypothetical protein
MNIYRSFSFSMMIIFALVGFIFLLYSSGVLTFFNSISQHVGMTPSPTDGTNFYLILAVGYMYLVTLLAYMMYRHPENRFFPLLLSNGKLASSALSLGFFLWHQPYLIYGANFIVDGFIGIVVLIFYFKINRVKK